MTTIYRLSSRSKSPAHENEQWLRDVAPSLGLCGGCKRFRTDRSVDVPFEGSFDESALNLFWSTGVGIIHIDLLYAIGRELTFKNLRLGRVLDAVGRSLPNHRTFRAVSSVIVRGGPDSKSRRCDVCGWLLYAPVKMHHLVGDVNGFKGLYGANLSGSLITDDSVVAHIDRKKFKNLGISKIMVIDQPVDRLPFDSKQLGPPLT